MKLKNEKLFEVAIFLKGIYSFFEFFAGIILLSISSSQIYNLIHDLFKHELLEDPNDLIANFILNLAGNMSSSLKLFLALYLSIMGIIKTGLVIALWKKKIIFYPIAIIFFSLFVIYQIYRYFLEPSFILIFLTILDLVIISLSYKEYKILKKI